MEKRVCYLGTRTLVRMLRIENAKAVEVAGQTLRNYFDHTLGCSEKLSAQLSVTHCSGEIRETPAGLR
jgi:hypothetical protein